MPSNMQDDRALPPVVVALGVQGTLQPCSDDTEWLETRHSGIHWKPLIPGTPSTGGMGVLIRMEPGCGYPAHRHLDFEDVLILAGGYRDEFGQFLQGTYLRYPPQSAHTPVALGDCESPSGPGNPACLLFAVARGGIEVVNTAPEHGD